MPTVPKAQPTQSIQGTTGQTMGNVNYAQGTGLSGVSEGLIQASSALQQAGQRIQRRNDTINRVKALNEFQTSVSTEWQRVSDEDDLSDPVTLQKFNTFLSDQKSKAMSYSGSADSMAQMEAQLTDLGARYERQAISGMRTAQIDLLKTSYGDSLNPILKGVTDGSVSVEQALNQVNMLSEDIGGSEESGWNLPRGMVFDLHDAAQSAVAMASIDRHLSVGDWQSAQSELDRHPEFANIMDGGQMQKVVKRISEQKYAYNIADQSAMRERNQRANDMGFSSWSQVPQSWKIAIATNQPIPGQRGFQPQTEAGKFMADRMSLANIYGEDSTEVRTLDAMNNSLKASKMSSDVGKLYADKERLVAEGKGPGDPAFDAVDNQINSKNPEFVKQQEKISKFPAAKVALSTFTRQAEQMRDDAKRAIMIWTGTDNWADAQKAAIDEDFALSTTGLGQGLGRFMAGSDVNEISSILTRIGGSRMLEALAALKASSPTGASGMGALNETEGKALMFQEGALDIMAPKTTVQSLLSVIENTDTAISNQQLAFDTAFGTVDIMPNETGVTAIDKTEKKTGMYDLNGNPL